MAPARPIQFVASGFASPGDDFAEPALDLNRLIIQHPASTFYMQVEGNRNKEMNIFDGDILVVDRSIKPKVDSVVISSNSDELEVSSFKQMQAKKIPNEDFWGVVINLIRKL